MRRGEVRVVHSRVSARDRYALIIGNDALNESETASTVLTAPIDTDGIAPETLVTVRITEPLAGIVRLEICKRISSLALAKRSMSLRSRRRPKVDAID